MTSILYSPTPFEQDVITKFAPAGKCLQEIINSFKDIPPELYDNIYIFVNGRLIPRNFWVTEYPGEGAIVWISIALHGGTTLRSFAQIAIVAAAAAASFLPGGQFISAAILIGGNLAVAALFRTPAVAQADAQQQSGEGAASASLSTNVLGKNKSLAKSHGWNRLFPPAITFPLTELIDDDEFTEVTFGLAGAHALQRIKSGETLTDGTTDIETEIRQGLSGEAPLSMITRYGYDETLNLIMSQIDFDPDIGDKLKDQSGPPADSLPKWHRSTSRPTEADEIWLTKWWIEGLYADLNPTADLAMAFRIRFRLLGSATWINGPELHFRHNQLQNFKKGIKLIWGTAGAAQAAIVTGGWTYAFVEVPVQNVGLTATDGSSVNPVGWNANAYFDNGVGLTNSKNVRLFTDHAVLYLDEGTFPKGQYEIETIHSAVYDPSDFDPATYNYNHNGVHIFDFFGYFYSGDDKYSHVDSLGIHQKVQIPRIGTVVNRNPAPLGGSALIAFRGKNRAFEPISVEANALVAAYDAVAGEWSGLNATNDPAAHARDILLGQVTSEPRLPVDLLDDLLDYRQHCIDNAFEIHAVIDGMQLWDAYSIAAAAGNGEPKTSGRWGIIFEHDRTVEVPVQIFTQRSAARPAWHKSLDTLADAYNITFRNGDNEFADDQLIVYRDGVNPLDLNLRFEEKRYDWAIDTTQITAQAQIQLRMEYWRDTVYEVEVFYDGRLVERGDLAGIQNEVWDADTGSAIIEAIYRDASNLVTGVELDADVPHYSDSYLKDILDVAAISNFRLTGQVASAQVRLQDGTLITKVINGPSGNSRRVEFTTPFAMPTANFGSGAEPSLAIGCEIAVGFPSYEFKRVLVNGIQNRGESTLTLLVSDDASAQIHA